VNTVRRGIVVFLAAGIVALSAGCAAVPAPTPTLTVAAVPLPTVTVTPAPQARDLDAPLDPLEAWTVCAGNVDHFVSYGTSHDHLPQYSPSRVTESGGVFSVNFGSEPPNATNVCKVTGTLGAPVLVLK
jgi:hypothetical protein